MCRILFFYLTALSFLLSQNHQSIHQQQLEYYNTNYIMPKNTDTTIVINSISPRSRVPSKEVFGYHPYWMGTAWTNYNFNTRPRPSEILIDQNNAILIRKRESIEDLFRGCDV